MADPGGMVNDYREYVAEGSLRVEAGIFFDNWNFIWDADFVRATVGKDSPLITILTDHAPKILEEIIQFINEHKKGIINEEDEKNFEGGD